MSRRRRGAAPPRLVALVGAVALTVGPVVPAAFAAERVGLPSSEEIAAIAKEREQQRPQTDADRALAKAKATGQRVVIDSLTTEFSETSATPDGHFAFTAHPDQQRVKRTDGWATLDGTLVRAADGSWAPKSAAGGVVLSPGGKGPLATMTSADGKKLALSAPFDLPTPQPDDSGTGLLYPNVIPDVDLKVTATKYGGMSTVLVVKTQQAAAGQALKSLKFSTEADGVTVTAGKDGTLSAKAADGKPRWTAPAPRMWDSAAGGAAASKVQAKGAAADAGKGTAASSADGPGASAAVATMPVVADASGLTLTPSQDLLAHGTAPYYIDPAWIPWNTSASAWTWVQSAHPTESGNYMRSGSGDTAYPGVGLCGTYPQGNSCIPSDTYRSFFQFDTIPLRGAAINSAQIDLQEYVSANFDCAKTYPLDLYLTGGFSSGTNWNNQPSKVGGSLDGSRWVGGSGHTGCYNNVGFSYNVSGVVKQYGPTLDNLTFGLYGNESDAYGFKRVTAQPVLSITYDRVPNPPANPGTYPAPRTVSPPQTNQACGSSDSATWAWLGAGSAQAQAVALTANVSSPTQAQVKTWNHIWDYSQSGSPDVANGSSDFVGNGGLASWWLPGGLLKDGHAYGWSAFSNDGLDGVSWGGPTPTCNFKVDLTPPTLSFPTTVADPTTQFPPSGNGQVTTLRAGQSGYVPFTATDPNPSGLNTSGVTCLRWSFDPQFGASDEWKCGSAMPAGKIAVTPGRWGTNVLYVQAQDNAGNVSPVGQYTFYVPWNSAGPAPVFGDVNADVNRTPDVVTAGPSGDLRVYTAPAAGPQYGVAATAAQSPGGDSWANYRTTHRGSLRNGPDVDDLIVHKDGDPKLWVYKNPGNTGVAGVFDTKVELAKPACVVTTSNPDCTGYATTWSGALQIAAVGDPKSTDRSPANANKNRTGLVTTETDPSGNAALWYYPSVIDNSFGNPVRLASTGWKDRDLISPGDWAGQSRPGLWARNRTTGVVTAHTFTVTTISSTDSDGITITYPVATGISAGKTAATGVTAAAWPRIGSDGDLAGNGVPSLWGITPQGVLQTWTGTRTGTTGDPGFTVTGPNTSVSPTSGTIAASGTKLTAGQSITGTDLRLTMRSDGNLVVTHRQVDSGVLWSTGTGGNAGAWAYVQPDGNFVVYRSDGNPSAATGAIWSTGTWGTGNANAYLKVQDDGNIVLYKADGGEDVGGALWSTGTMKVDPKLGSGTQLTSGRWTQVQTHVLEMQEDGNFVLYRRSDGVPTWNTATWNNRGASLTVQPDGNTVLKNAGGNPIWHTGTWQFADAYLKLQDDGRLLVYKNSGSEDTASTVWTTATLRNGAGLPSGRMIRAKTTYLIMQYDGNLVLHRNSDNVAIWASGTDGNSGATLKVQDDGNVVVYRTDGSAAWASNTNGNSYAYLKLQDDGNLVVYKADGGEGVGGALWASNTFA
ncbi:hypothetical protein [Kitasatospora griseola]